MDTRISQSRTSPASEFLGRVALITGSTSGIGLGIAVGMIAAVAALGL